jgi:hypothetical protein
MAHMTWEPTYSLPAAADLSASQYRAVVINGSCLIAVCGLGAMPEGVLDNLPKAGEMARIFIFQRYVGKIKVGVGGVAAGGLFSSDATGKAIVGATGAARFGKALMVGAAGDVITALFDFSGRYGVVP